MTSRTYANDSHNTQLRSLSNGCWARTIERISEGGDVEVRRDVECIALVTDTTMGGELQGFELSRSSIG